MKYISWDALWPVGCLQRKKAYKHSMRTRSYTLLRFACRTLALTLTALLVFPPNLAVTPARADFFSFGIKDEKELGEKFNVLIRSKLPMVEDLEVANYVQDLVDRLTSRMAAQPFPFKSAVVLDNSVNAFAAPAGYVFVFTGLILNMNHECEVAGVMGHELAHVTQRHIAKRIEQGRIISLAALAGVLAGLVLGAAGGQRDAGAAMMMGSQAAATQTMLSYSRDDEREADDVGTNYLVAAGYPPRGLPQAFEVLYRLRLFHGGGTIPAYLSTHPDITDRIGYLTERVKRMPKDIINRQDNDERFLRIQTLLRTRYGDPAVALAFYTKKGPAMTKVDRLGMAIALGRTNDTAAAREAFEKALAEGGGDSLWQREAGRFFLKIRDFNRARIMLRQAVEQNSGDVVAAAEYANILAQEGNFPQAMELMRNVIRRVPESPDARAQAGRTYGEAGDVFQAHLNLAYAAVYSNDRKQSRFQMEKAKGYARTEEQHKEYAKLEKVFKERSEFWPKGPLSDL